jgi:hypothetical protein
MYRAWVSASDSDGDRAQLRCSAKGCRARARTELQWRNPRIHEAGRVKHWLACDDHADYLADFLARRNFLIERRTID